MLKIKQIDGLQTELDSKLNDDQLSTDINLGNSDTLIPSQLAAKTYIDNTTIDITTAMNYKGTFDASIEIDFSSISPGVVGDFYKVINNCPSYGIEGLNINNGDMIIVNKTITLVTASDIDVIDNTESPDLIHWLVDVITDDTLTTATATNVATSQTVKDYVTTIASTREDIFTEVNHEYVHSGGTNPANTNLPITVANTIKSGFAVLVSIEGVDLMSTEFTASGTTVTINVPYTIEDGEIVKIIYKY